MIRLGGGKRWRVCPCPGSEQGSDASPADARDPVSSEELGLPRGRVGHWPDRMTKRSPFRYFRTSPEIIRLGDALHRYPVIAAQRRRLTARTRDRDQPRNGALLVEPFRSNVCRGTPSQAGGSNAWAQTLALAPRRSLCEDQRRDTLPLIYTDGRIAVIKNSRRAVYVNDQRVELLGADGLCRRRTCWNTMCSSRTRQA